MKIPEYYKINPNLSLCANQVSLSCCEVFLIDFKKPVLTGRLWQGRRVFLIGK